MGDQAAIDALTKVLEQVTLKTQKPKIPTFRGRGIGKYHLDYMNRCKIS